jgi:hypothetical protein
MPITGLERYIDTVLKMPSQGVKDEFVTRLNNLSGLSGTPMSPLLTRWIQGNIGLFAVQKIQNYVAGGFSPDELRRFNGLFPNTFEGYLIRTELYGTLMGTGALPAELLDAYPGAGAAYSVRKLSSTYTGAAIRVRRSSDNAEQDIGFVGLNLDTTALSSFVGASSAFVTRWYDQSGNGRNMSQTTAGLQPSIVSSGTIITRNGNVSIYFNSAFNIYLTSGYSFSNGPLSTIGVVNADGTTSSDEFGLFHSSNFEIGRHSNDKWGFGNLNTQAVIVTTVPGVAGYLTSAFTLTNNATYLIYSNWNGNLNPVKHRRNAIAGTDSANSGSTLRTGSTSMVYKKGFISEMIIYQSDQASNVAGMETNINDYFNIYP